jgi:asparagine synthase (glutamine-hydrolysing)
MMRAGSFVHRPAQLDMFHIDIFYRGENIAIDPGTYSYNGEGAWRQIPLGASRCHNTITVDSCEPAAQVSKFLYLPWNCATELAVAATPGTLAFSRALRGRNRTHVEHTRIVVTAGDDTWLVIDRLAGDCQHNYRMHWLLGDSLIHFEPGDCNLEFAFNAGIQYVMQCWCSHATKVDMVRGDESSEKGWFSPYYLTKQPANSFAQIASADSAVFITRFAPSLCTSEERQDLASMAKKCVGWSARDICAQFSNACV